MPMKTDNLLFCPESQLFQKIESNYKNCICITLIIPLITEKKIIKIIRNILSSYVSIYALLRNLLMK